MLKKSGLRTRTKSRLNQELNHILSGHENRIIDVGRLVYGEQASAQALACGHRSAGPPLACRLELFAALFTFDKIALQWKESPNSKAMILMSPISCNSKKRTTKCLQATYVQSFPAFSGWVKGREQWKLLVIAIKKTEKNKKINWEIP